MSDSLRCHGLQHTRLPCDSLSPRACSNACPLGQWCHPTVSSSVIPFSSCPQSFSASGTVQWVGSSHQVAKVLEPQHQSFHLRLTGLISLLSKELSKVFPSTTIQKHQFLVLSLLYGPTLTSIMTMGKTLALTRWTFVGKVMSLLFNTLSRFVIDFLPTLKIPPNHTTCIQCYAV